MSAVARSRRRGSALALCAVAVVAVAPPVSAVGRPATDGPLPEAGGPTAPVTLDRPCRTTVADPRPPSAPGSGMADPDAELHLHGSGEGQVVAVIDTGVRPGPRLPRVRGAGDLVSDRDGTEDCDAHGTLVAGIIAATGGEGGFSGVAPGVEIVSIRQSSSVFRPRDRQVGEDAPVGTGVGTLSTLARALRIAADSGARVINISEVACVPAGTSLADATLGAAVRYAAVEKDAVLVAAAGNVGGACREQNPERGGPEDDGWASVRTIATPAWYDDLVLTVGAVDPDGRPAEYSLRGPWVDVAAPGTALVSVGADGAGWADRIVDSTGAQAPITGTSFAAPRVAGVAALVRQAHPRLSAREVIARIEATALPVAGGRDPALGHGVVDPVAALTAVSPAAPRGPVSAAVAAPPPVSTPAGPGIGGAVALGALVLGGLVLAGVTVARLREGGRRG